jgi:RNA polymerase sigma factor (sigma-70 family)
MLVTMTSDLELLRRFARDKSQDAFTTLVNRHVNLVYSAALRQVRSPQLAEEVSQSVSADLAKLAATPASPLSGSDASSQKTLTPWLYAVTRRTAIDAIRKESRRQLREQIAVEMNAMNATADDWTQIEPLLDDAMAALDETDRSAILLRFFENKSLREVGEALGTNDDAAQKRVSRALDRLREFFSKRNVTIGASGLAVVISANAVQAAPVGLAATTSVAAVLAGTAVQTSTVITATKVIAMTTLQKTAITAALAFVAGVGIYEAHQASTLREQNRILQQQQAPLADQLRQLQSECEDATNRLASLLAENEQLKSNPNQTELLRLRGEVGVLRSQIEELKHAQTKPKNSPTQASNPAPPTALPADYPTTADGATKGIFDTWARGDWNSFSTNFTESGVPLDSYLTEEMKSNLVGMEIISIGEATNWLSNGNIKKWFVPYDIRFKDGSEKKFRLSIGQDKTTGRYFFDGGF